MTTGESRTSKRSQALPAPHAPHADRTPTSPPPAAPSQDDRPSAAAPAVRRLLLALFLNFGITSIACYSLLPLLPVLMEGWHSGPLSVGVVLFAFSALRFCGFIVVDRMDFSRVRPTLTLSLVAAASLMGTAALLRGERTLVVILMCGVAVAMSVNSVTVRTCIGDYVESAEERVGAFSRLQVVTNLCSAGGPMLGALLYFQSPGRWMLVTALIFALSAAACFLALPKGLKLAKSPKPGRRAWWRDAVRNRSLRSVALASFICFTLYSQLFSAMPLYLFDIAHPAVAGSVFLINALLVVVLQLPVGKRAGREMTRSGGGFRMFAAVAVCMAFSFLLTGLSRWVAALLVLAVLVFTVGETILGAVNDQAFMEVKGDLDTLSAVKCRMLITALGSSTGALVGGSASLVMAHAWRFDYYWYLVAIFGVCAAGTFWSRNRGPTGALQDRP
ncbi:MFS transporter [Streptomyces sp. ID05-04B]|uniref:MFS transporter n=1 Tax=unclassified Streptomyces TaxID=2593676 RepID=UPI00131F41B2|nr:MULTISPECIES: MFS transporter [unclassified Streptomyces]MDX5565532.1 MFS transporter [Streptomyces sp. ID05-04B]